MTRARQPKPTAPPLATTLRAAIASDWRTLAALDTLAGARGSDARRLVHEALRALRGEGCVLEERVGRAGVEVRLAPASPTLHSAADDGPGVVVLIDDLPDPFGPPPGWEPAPVEVASAAPLQPAPALDAPAPPVGQAAPVEAVDGPARSREPGPSSRCAVCGAAYKRHDEGGAAKHVPGTCAAFKALPRGRPRVTPVAVASEAAPTTPAEPETSRGESPGEQDHATCDTDDARPDGSNRVPALRVATDRAPGKPRVPRPRAHPVPSADGVDQSASRVGAKGVATAGDVAPPCRPPLCHADDINEPARVRGFARPLCETHRRWVEGAGGTLASAADMAALREETV